MKSEARTSELDLVQAVPQVLAADILHLVVQRAVVLEGIVQRHDTGVIQAVQGLSERRKVVEQTMSIFSIGQ